MKPSSRKPTPESRASTHEVTRILEAISSGDKRAADLLFPLVYDELRRLARLRMAREKPGQTLQPTALVHDAYLRLVGDVDAKWETRAHFFGAAALAMRRILVERARRRRSARHGGQMERVTLDEPAVGATSDRAVDLLSLDRALQRLEAYDARLAAVVMLQFFGGLEIEETARALGVSRATVKRDWTYARAWLYEEIQGGHGGER